MIAVEYALYKSNVTDDRFTAIYDKLVHVQATQAKDLEASKQQRMDINKVLEETLFKIELSVKGLDQYKTKYDALVLRTQEQSKALDDYMQKCLTKVSNYFRFSDERINEMNEKLAEYSTKQMS